MAALILSLLGPFQVSRDGQPLTSFATDAARALLAYLAMEAGLPQRRTALAGLLWPEEPDAGALQNLRQAISRLRQAIGDREAGPPLLLVSHDSIQLRPEARYEVDVAAFCEAIAAARGHAHRRLEACPACVARLRDAVELYRGEFMAGFSLPSAPFEEWLLARRETLRLQALDALHALAAHHERRGEHEPALRYARRQLELEPWHEAAHRQCMRALALSGQRAAALAQYEACRRALAEELGVEPEAETTRLYEQIRDHPETGFLPETRFPNNLPAQTTPFVGREQELAQIGAHLGEPSCRLVALVGPGGSGKTRLALEAAAEQVDAFRDGVFFVSMAPVASPEGMVPAIAQALGLSFHAGEDPRQQLVRYLRSKELLLVLDNLEHLAEGMGLLGELLSAAPGLWILATSRARLGLQGEQVLFVGGMEYPALAPGPSPKGQGELDGALRYSAVQLFLHAVRRARPGYEPSAGDLTGVAHLCRLVEGMPLALLLAAAWADALSPAQIAAQVAQGLGFLETELHDLPERQRSMRAVCDASWGLLSEREREAFAALSVFRGGFTAEAAQEVAGADLRTLAGLVRKSFLQVEAGGRYQVHELLRQYGEEQLARTPEEEGTTRDRHAAYYAAVLERWAQDAQGPRQSAAYQEIKQEAGNAGAAWAWAVHRERWADLKAAAEGLSILYRSQAYYAEGLAALAAAEDRLRNSTGAGTPCVSGERLCLQARVVACQIPLVQDAETWQRLLQRCEALLAHPDLAGPDARAERRLFLRNVLTSDPTASDQTIAYAREALTLCGESGDQEGMAQAHSFLGICAFIRSNYEEAAQHFSQSDVLRQVSHPGRLGAAFWLTCIAVRQGQVSECERRLCAFRTLATELGVDLRTNSLALWGQGSGHCMLGLFAQAEAESEECAAYLRGRGERIYLGRVLVNSSETRIHLGLYSQARDAGQEALALARERGEPLHEGWVLALLGSATLAEGQVAAAMELLAQADAVCRAGGDRFGLAEALAWAGYAARRLGRAAQARGCLAEALQLGREMRSLRPVWIVLPAAALLLADRGEAERAVELYILAWSVSHVANSRWYEDVAGRELAAVAAGLPPEVRAAAQARGRARDLWATAQELLDELGEPESP